MSKPAKQTHTLMFDSARSAVECDGAAAVRVPGGSQLATPASGQRSDLRLLRVHESAHSSVL